MRFFALLLIWTAGLSAGSILTPPAIRAEELPLPSADELGFSRRSEAGPIGGTIHTYADERTPIPDEIRPSRSGRLVRVSAAVQAFRDSVIRFHLPGF